jgi:hypothetical protein
VADPPLIKKKKHPSPLTHVTAAVPLKVTVVVVIVVVVAVAPTIAAKLAPQRVKLQPLPTIVVHPRMSSTSVRLKHAPKQTTQATIAHAAIATAAGVVVTVAKMVAMFVQIKSMR